MKRPWQIWLALFACGALVASAMAWLSVHALRADRERTTARAEADLEQRVSLALWRMDTKLAPLIAEESARPHFYYEPVITVEAPRSKGGPDVEQVASPLMIAPNAGVLLNFNANADGTWTSPQAPAPDWTAFACSNGMTIDQIGDNRKRLDELSSNVSFDSLLSQMPVQPLPQVSSQSSSVGASFSPDPSQATGSLRSYNSNGAAQQPDIPAPSDGNNSQSPFYSNYIEPPNAPPEQDQGAGAPTDEQGAANQQVNQQAAQVAAPMQATNQALDGLAPVGRVAELMGQAQAWNAVPQSKGVVDFGDRNIRYQSQVEQEYVKQRRDNQFRRLDASEAVTPVVENVSRPLWVGDRLLLARRVERASSTMIQGSWLDWPKLKHDLLAETADLLPGADLVAVAPNDPPDPTRMLAGLPVRLVTTSVDLAARQASPLKWALGVGWAAVALALLAVAGLLWGVMALSERRAAFVSSVTHELRTPLTTFRMYSELLARDMAPSAERRQEYLETLRTEAERLTHLVDNVLAYARLERGRAPRRAEQTTPAALVERFEPRLADRAKNAGMLWQSNCAGGVAGAELRTDVGVVEQILFNLVDNAAKYAGRAEDRRIHLDVTQENGHAAFAVRDHGPGFASLKAAERAAAFSKSAEEAADTAPGVGLGLALCRRLARELGGRLDVAKASDGQGAIVTLRLPVEA
jgi:signal transduction histidine kinase